MKKLISRFVENYKVILDTKKNYNYKDFQFKTFKNVIFVTSVMIIVFIFFGLIFNLLNDLHYVFLTESITILFATIIHKYTKELQFQNIYRLDYNIYITLIFNLTYLIALISGVNSIVFLLLFRNIISIVLVIILLALLVLASIFLGILNRKSWFELDYLNSNVHHTKLGFAIVIYALLFISFLYVLNIGNITLAYSITTIILVLSYYIKQRLLNDNKTIVLTFGIFISLVLLTSYIHAPKYNDLYQENIFTGEVVKNIDIDFNYTGEDLYSYGDYIYTEDNGVLYEYNQDLSLNRMVNPETLDVIRYFWNDSKLYAIIDIDNNFYEVYDITNLDDIQLVHTFEYYSSFFDYDYRLYFYEDELYYSSYGIEDNRDYSLNGSWDNNSDKISENTIFLQNQYEAIFIKDNELYYLTPSETVFNKINWFIHIFYSNNKIAIKSEETNTYIIMNFDDFFYAVEDYEYIDTGLTYLDGFYFDGTNYYFDKDYLIITDQGLNLIHKVDINYDIFFTNNYFITTKIVDTSSSSRIEFIDLEMLTFSNVYSNSFDYTYLVINPLEINTEIIGVNQYLNDYYFAIIITLFFILPVRLPGYKGAEIYV